jgi:hypothetical protein
LGALQAQGLSFFQLRLHGHPTTPFTARSNNPIAARKICGVECGIETKSIHHYCLLSTHYITILAEGVRFELTRSLRPCRFSRPVPSTTRPTFPVQANLQLPVQLPAMRSTWPARRASCPPMALIDIPVMGLKYTIGNLIYLVESPALALYFSRTLHPGTGLSWRVRKIRI